MTRKDAAWCRIDFAFQVGLIKLMRGAYSIKLPWHELIEAVLRTLPHPSLFLSQLYSYQLLLLKKWRVLLTRMRIKV